MVDGTILASLDDLQTKYARSLDQRDLAAWLSCFAEETSYECLSRENAEQGLPLAIMMDDCRARLRDRVKFIEEVWAGTFEDYFMRHFIQRLESAQIGDRLYRVTSNFMVVYTSARRHSEILAAGMYQDEISTASGTALFTSKKAILDTVTTPRYLVYPL